ncbi:MAG: ribosome biogenesis GTPase YlqF [Oscillospiraceae bacterium]|nr:ribosome biogenesis GTPase YlqF [Oscillospiraceae bacterium]
MNIQWFPGHMTKARRMIESNIKLIDAVCEVIDARIPYSSRNPDLDGMTAGKPRLVILNRTDQADPGATKHWVAKFRDDGAAVLETDSKSGKGVGGFSPAVRSLLAEKIARYNAKGQTGRVIRAMVVGIPNVGKSSFINRVAKRKAADASDRPGVTRGKQWIKIDKGFELLDTPGVLWPRFEDQTVAENLAFTGAIRDQIMDLETLGANLMFRLKKFYPQRIFERYKIDEAAGSGGFELLEAAAKKRGFLMSGGELDLGRMAAVLLDEFRGGKLGRVTLEIRDAT